MQESCKTPVAIGGIRSPLRTLIVDDSTIIVTSLRRILDAEALIQVVGTAANGSEALHKAESLAPDLVLLDLFMPDMDGLRTMALLRRRLPNARIIIVTMDETVKSRVATRAHGADGFVGKTQITRTLMAEIQRVFLLNNAANEKGTS